MYINTKLSTGQSYEPMQKVLLFPTLERTITINVTILNIKYIIAGVHIFFNLPKHYYNI